VRQDGRVTSATSDIDVALAAAAAGAAVVRAAYGAEHIRYAKIGSDFATETDIAAENAIFAVIESARPADARIGEESGRADGSNARRWLVDPLCGTLNFAAQTPLMAVNVALADDDSTVAAVSIDPISGEIFWTDGERAFVRRDGVDVPLTPSPLSGLVDIDCDAPLDSAFVGGQLVADQAFRAAFGVRVSSTTLTVAWAAAGRRAAYVSDGTFLDNVHFAAGIAISRAAGCVVTDFAGAEVESGRGLIVAADAATHERIVRLIGPHLRDGSQERGL